MNECKHKWIFQETKKHTITKCDYYRNYTATYHRVDRYYCENCCDINEVEKIHKCNLPFGGINDTSRYAPVWY